MECDPALKLLTYPENDSLFSKLDTYNLYLDNEPSDSEQTYRQFREVYDFAYRYIQPAALVFGILGSLLVAKALIRWRKAGKGDVAVLGFVLLAVVDVLYCAAGLVEWFLTPQASFYSAGSAYFLAYDRAIFNSLVLVSACLVAVLCLKPGGPFWQVMSSPAVVTIASSLVCIPLFLEWKVEETQCTAYSEHSTVEYSEQSTCFAITQGPTSYKSLYLAPWYMAFFALLVQVVRVAAAAATKSEKSDTERMAIALQVFCLVFLGPGIVITFVGDTAFHAREWEDKNFYGLRVAVLFSGWMQCIFFVMKVPMYCMATVRKSAVCISKVDKEGEEYKYKVLT